jgi:hypothetical protein
MAIALFAALTWTVLFSLSNTPGIRGYRNLGILAAYVGLGVFLFRAPWQEVSLTWAAFAVAGGIAYTFWEVLQRVRTPKHEEKPKVGFTHLFPALALWPVMVPEAVEYALAELGILKSKP